MDDLFEGVPTPAAVTDAMCNLSWNYGIFLFSPCAEILHNLTRFVNDHGEKLKVKVDGHNLGNDQPTLNAFFLSNYTDREVTLLPFFYNVLVQTPPGNGFETGWVNWGEKSVGPPMARYLLKYYAHKFRTLHLQWPKPYWPMFEDVSNAKQPVEQVEIWSAYKQVTIKFPFHMWESVYYQNIVHDLFELFLSN